MNITRLQFLAIVAVAGLTGYYVGTTKVTFSWSAYRPIQVVSKEAPKTVQPVDFSLFWTVWEKLESSYYEKKSLDPQKMLFGAISGMVEGLEDPYTMFLPPKENSSFRQGLAGQFSGIGAELGIREKQIIVVAPLNDTPAQRAGIEPGDAILKVDGQVTAGWTLSQTVEKIRGPKGTAVTLTILRKSEGGPRDVRIVRDTIQIKSVEGWVKNIKCGESGVGCRIIEESCPDCPRVAYIRLSQFGDNTNKEWLSLANRIALEMQKDKRVRGVILDLRNNPGGYLSEATFISSEFIKDGVVVIQEKRSGEKMQFSVSRKGLLLDVPVVVLLNKGSASASEIVAAALKEHKRAKLVGETSFGKGTIQEAHDLGKGVGLHVTVAKWLTPKGEWPHGKGISPDIVVARDEKDASRDAQLERAVEELIQ